MLPTVSQLVVLRVCVCRVVLGGQWPAHTHTLGAAGEAGGGVVVGGEGGCTALQKAHIWLLSGSRSVSPFPQGNVFAMNTPKPQ